MPVNIDRWVTLTINYQMGDSEPAATVLSYKSPVAAPGASDLTAFLNAWWTANGSVLRNTLPTSTVITSLVARTHYNPPYVEASLTGIFPLAGTRGGDPLPNNASDLISWRTPSIGPKFRGRSFIPAGSETDTNLDRFISGLTSAMGTLAASIILGVVTGGLSWFPYVASRAGGFLTPILSALVDNFIKSQEDRLPKHHRHHRP